MTHVPEPDEAAPAATLPGDPDAAESASEATEDDPGGAGLSRRAFVRAGVLAGAATAAGATGVAGAIGVGPGSGRRASDDGSRPSVDPPRGPGDRSPTPGNGDRAAAAVPPFELEGVGIAELRDRMAAGELTALGIASLYTERIEALDRSGPTLRHLLELNPDALGIARERDREREAGNPRGPLHGIPVLLKDNVDTGDRMDTSAGSLALVGAPAPRDAFLVERLRAAGAVILGKLNLSEWANFRSSESSSGWSGRGGQGRNPYALDRTPCGSSSGSAASVAAEYAPVAVGTETNGSIMCPASACSVVGIKPTVGLVSRSGIIPISHTQDTAGPFARTVEDAAILLGAMTGVDPRDDRTTESRGHLPPESDYTRFLDPDALRGARIGIPRGGLAGFTAETDRIFEDVLAALEDAGATLVDPADVPHVGEYGSEEYDVLLYEFKAGIGRYLRERRGAAGERVDRGALPRSLADLIRFNEENAGREMPYFGQEIFHRAQEKGSLEDEAYREALEKILRLSREEGIDAAFEEHDLDAMVAITSAPPWPIDLVNGDRGHGSSYSTWAIAGYPAITLPAGYAFGLPVGVSFYGRAWEEPKLLGYAYAYESATGARRPPAFAPSAEVAA